MKLPRRCVTTACTACATSSGCSAFPASLRPRPENSVATLPGQITLTRIPWSRKSSAMQPESPCTPHFDAQYNPPPANVFLPASELILMMSPSPCRISEGTTARETRNTLFRFVFIIRSHASSLFSCAGPKSPMPALLTRIPIGPSFVSVAETSFSTSSARVTSAVCQKTFLVRPCSASAVSRSFSLARPNSHVRAQLGELHCNRAPDSPAPPSHERNLTHQQSAGVSRVIRFTYASHRNSSFVRATLFVPNSS